MEIILVQIQLIHFSIALKCLLKQTHIKDKAERPEKPSLLSHFQHFKRLAMVMRRNEDGLSFGAVGVKQPILLLFARGWDYSGGGRQDTLFPTMKMMTTKIIVIIILGIYDDYHYYSFSL